MEYQDILYSRGKDPTLSDCLLMYFTSAIGACISWHVPYPDSKNNDRTLASQGYIRSNPFYIVPDLEVKKQTTEPVLRFDLTIAGSVVG